MRDLFYTLSLWFALAPGTQSTTRNKDAGQTDSTATDGIATPPPPLRLADVQQCPAAPKPSCHDAYCQGARHHCATQYLCSSENPFTDPSSSSSGHEVILAGCRCCPLPIYIECTDALCAAPVASGSRVCAAEPLAGCTCQTHDDRFRAAQERTAGWVWPMDKFDPAYDVDISDDEGDEAQAQAQAQAQPAGSSSGVVVVSSSSAGPPPPMATTTNMATVPPLALLLRDYYGAMKDQADLKFLARRD